jgi:RNA polymerase sigma factor (sigma-70 family)
MMTYHLPAAGGMDVAGSPTPARPTGERGPTSTTSRPVVSAGSGRNAPTSIVELLDAHGAEIYRHLRRLSPTAEDAADLHQETFLRAHRAWPRLPPDANRRAWLHRIAANVAIDAHRRREARPSVAATSDGSVARHTSPAAERAAGPRVDPAARAEAAELREAVRAALGSLPWRERTAVAARVLDGSDYAVVADLLDCTDENARQLVSRGLRRLRAALAPHLEIDR